MNMYKYIYMYNFTFVFFLYIVSKIMLIIENLCKKIQFRNYTRVMSLLANFHTIN